MAVIITELQKKGTDVQLLKKTMNLQLASMLLLNAAGNLIWYKRQIEEMRTLDVLAHYYPALIFIAVMALVITVLAARNETRYFKENRVLLG